MADILGYLRNIKTNGWIPQNYHDTAGDGTKYATDVNVVAGSLAGGVTILQTTPGTTNGVVLKVAATAAAAYRTGVVAADVMALPGTVTCTKLTGVGAMTGGEYYIKVVAMNAHGRTTPVAGNTTVTTETTNLGVRAAFAAVTGATHYGIYATTAADPLWVGRITEAQRASGIIIDAVGSTAAGGTAGAVDIYAIGTGLAASVNNAVNFAYVIPASPVVCTGYEYVHFHCKYSRTGDAVAPALTVAPFLSDGTTYQQGQVYTHSFGGVAGAYNSNEFVIEVRTRGNPAVALLVQNIAGTGASLSVTAVLS